MSENAKYRLLAGKLVDELKLPENADILDAFVHYDAKAEGGWINFDLLLSDEDLKFYQKHVLDICIIALTPEQIVRWKAINEKCDIQGSGRSDSMVWLLAQLMLGRLDVMVG